MNGLVRIIKGENHIDFARWWPKGLVVSGILVVLSLGSLMVRELNLGVEFTGGISVEASAPGVTTDQAKAALADAGIANARVQIVGEDVLRIQTTAESQVDEEALRTTMATLARTDVAAISVSAVSPSWGDDITKQAGKALVFFLIAISLYLTVRLELKMAVGALVALIHDLVISVGIYSVFQFEVSPGTVIAFLTILGYSIYDTVVVFDKIKENEARAGLTQRMTYTDMVSLSMNQVLLRSLNTTVSSIIPVVSILVVGVGIMGAVALGQFGVALFVGLVIGAYSSVMVATPVVAMIKEREPKYQALRERLEATGGSRRTAMSSDRAPLSAVGPVVGGDVSVAARSATRPAGAVPTTAIPPRPRKQGKKR